MAEEFAQERTEQPTPKRLEEAREQGQVVKSIDLNSALVLLTGLLILSVGGSALASSMGSVARSLFSRAASIDITTGNVQRLFLDAVAESGMILLPVIGGIMLIGVAANVAQVGFLFTGAPLKPRFAKLNPATGLRRLFISRRSAVELTKNLIKVAIVALVCGMAISDLTEDTLAIADGDPAMILSFMGSAAIGIGLKTGLVFLGLAAADYIFQRFEHEREMRMTREQVREEERQTEGNPQTRSRIRAIQRRIAYRRMMAAVPTADVVVTNPTHYAVAIKYDAAEMSAPTVVAKGVDLIAQKIKEIAAEHGIPCIEDRALAQALYKSVEIDDEIPEKLFQAVAQVLAYLYRLNAGRRSGGKS